MSQRIVAAVLEALLFPAIRWGSVGPLLLISLAIMGGALLGIANPQAWVAIAAVFASAHLADSPTTDAAAKIAVLTVMIIVICATWLFAGTSIAPVLRDPRRARIVNAALAVGLVAATALVVFH